MIYSASDVFCDAVTATYAPGTAPFRRLESFAESLGGSVKFRDDRATGWSLGDGLLLLQSSSRWERVEAKGRALVHIRAAGQFLAFVSLLASEAHRVTRVDAALDVAEDGAAVIGRLRSSVGARMRLGRKSQKVTWMLSTRDDGLESGTMYVGTRSAERQLRVYDKELEALEKRGELLPPTTRYELQIRSGLGPTLRDVVEPASMFWANMPGDILPPPAGVEPWVPGGEFIGWSADVPEPLIAERLERRVQFSPDLESMRDLADEMGPEGRRYLLRLLARRLGVDLGAS